MDYRVYLGGFQPVEGVLFLKAGMTSDVKSRMQHYASMLPGGLSFLWTAKVESRRDAFSGEHALMSALEAIEGINPISGEWFRCEGVFGKSAAIDELLKIGTAHWQVVTGAVAPFGGGKRGRGRA
ncbi:GIY-YIG nuclease family protein [Dyella jiangningensis]